MAAVSSGNVKKRTLADISNFPVKQLVRDGNPQGTTTKDYEQLLKEKLHLMKILAERDRIIEVSAIELQKMRINQHKMQEQNKQLAKSHARLLAEVNANNEMIKSFQHDLGCKNGLLKALQCELKSQDKVKLTAIEDQENLAKRGQDAGEQDTSNSRIHLKSLGLSRQVQSKENDGNKRACVRRQSGRFKPEEAKSKGDFCAIPDTKTTVCPLPSDSELKDGVASTVKDEDKEGIASVCTNEEEKKLTAMDDQGEVATRGQDADRQDTSKRRSQSKSLSPSRQVQSKEKAANKRACVRRQSSKFKSEEAKSMGDLCEIPETKSAVCPPLTDSVLEDGVASTVTTMKDEDKEGSVAIRQEQGRPSIGRPSRVAAKKIQSYKEIPLKMKMRRPE